MRTSSQNKLPETKKRDFSLLDFAQIHCYEIIEFKPNCVNIIVQNLSKNCVSKNTPIWIRHDSFLGK